MKIIETMIILFCLLLVEALSDAGKYHSSGGSRIYQTGHQPLNLGQKPIIWEKFAENCVEILEIRPGSLVPPWIHHCTVNPLL